jgi:hypothetical protein
MIDESEIQFLGLSTVIYTSRLELGFIFRKGDFTYVIMDAKLSDIDDPVDGACIAAWFHTVRLATREEKIIYEVMKS